MGLEDCEPLVFVDEVLLEVPLLQEVVVVDGAEVVREDLVLPVVVAAVYADDVVVPFASKQGNSPKVCDVFLCTACNLEATVARPSLATKPRAIACFSSNSLPKCFVIRSAGLTKPWTLTKSMAFLKACS